jgi:hypothetical protein
MRLDDTDDMNIRDMNLQADEEAHYTEPCKVLHEPRQCDDYAPRGDKNTNIGAGFLELGQDEV